MVDLAKKEVLEAAYGGEEKGRRLGLATGAWLLPRGRLTTVDAFTAPDAAIYIPRPALNRRHIHFYNR